MRKNFWKSPDSEAFSSFATMVPSGPAAYAIVDTLLDLQDKHILDFGCFRGISSYNMLKRGAASVVGVERMREHIKLAQRVYAQESKLRFHYIDIEDPIPTDHLFDACSMTFVHPTIDNVDELYFSFEKISQVLKQDAPLVILGLHKNSFDPQYRFTYYKHSAPSIGLIDGASFKNELKLFTGETLQFDDYYWSKETLIDLLDLAGFRIDRVVDIGEMMESSLQEPFQNALKLINETPYTVSFIDEWKAPLYQIICARKR